MFTKFCHLFKKNIESLIECGFQKIGVKKIELPSDELERWLALSVKLDQLMYTTSELKAQVDQTQKKISLHYAEYIMQSVMLQEQEHSAKSIH